MKGTPTRWEQPDRGSGWRSWEIVGRAAPGLVVAAVPAATLLTGTPLPPLLSVGLVALGAFLFLRRFRLGGPWQGFQPPAHLSYAARDAELGASLGGRLSLPGQAFENVVRGRRGDWDWTYAEITRGLGQREGLLVIDLGVELAPVLALRVATLPTGEPVSPSLRDAALPGRIVGRTGPYRFPSRANPDPTFLTSLITPAMTAALDLGSVAGWSITDHHLYATTDGVDGSAEGIMALREQANQLSLIADAIQDATGFVPPPEQRWPTLE